MKKALITLGFVLAAVPFIALAHDGIDHSLGHPSSSPATTTSHKRGPHSHHGLLGATIFGAGCIAGIIGTGVYARRRKVV